jgi:hypothetical protein
MVVKLIQKIFNNNNNNMINRDGDLKPLGIKYTIKGEYSFNETFECIFKERLKK